MKKTFFELAEQMDERQGKEAFVGINPMKKLRLIDCDDKQGETLMLGDCAGGPSYI